MYKTLSPNQDGDAIGGTVNLVTKTRWKSQLTISRAKEATRPFRRADVYGVGSGTVGERYRLDKKLGFLFGGDLRS